VVSWILEDGEALPPAGERRDIVELKVSEYAEIEWEELSGLPALERLTISGWGVFDLEILPVLPRLQRLTIDPCPDLEDVSALLRQPSLTHLELCGGAGTDLDRLKVETLSRLTGLRSLGFYRDGLSDLSFVAGMTVLERLDLFSRVLRNLGPLAGCASLRKLNLDGCNEVAGVDALAALPNLGELWLSGPVTADLAPLAGTPLERLVIQHRRIKDLPVDLESIARIPGLETLEILSADLVGLDGLAGSSVRTLRLGRCLRLTDLSAVGALPNLETLRISDARALRRVHLGEPRPALREVRFTECRALTGPHIDDLRQAHPGIDIALS
jgi:Leucine-rich repeat (LRR) protein